MGGRIVAIDATAEDGHRRSSGLERPAVRFAVDSPGHSADDDEPCGRELAPKRPRYRAAIRRARARTHDRNGRPCEQLE